MNKIMSLSVHSYPDWEIIYGKEKYEGLALSVAGFNYNYSVHTVSPCQGVQHEYHAGL